MRGKRGGIRWTNSMVDISPTWVIATQNVPNHRRVVDIHLWKLGKFLIVLQGGFPFTACDLHSQGHNSK